MSPVLVSASLSEDPERAKGVALPSKTSLASQVGLPTCLQFGSCVHHVSFGTQGWHWGGWPHPTPSTADVVWEARSVFPCVRLRFSGLLDLG